MKRVWIVIATMTLVVIAGGLVLVLLLPRGRGHTAVDRTRPLLFVLADVLEQYRDARGQYPGTDEGLEVLVREGYLRKVPLDAWDNPFQYRFPGSKTPGSFELWSTGADGKSGGVGEDADLIPEKR